MIDDWHVQLASSCDCGEKFLTRDAASGMRVCQKCGLETPLLEREDNETPEEVEESEEEEPTIVDVEREDPEDKLDWLDTASPLPFDTTPTNAVNFGGNLGTANMEPVRKLAVKQMYGNRLDFEKARNSLLLTKPCPYCHGENRIPLLGSFVTCTGCGSDLGIYRLHWLPINKENYGNSNLAPLFYNDVRELREVYAPDDTPTEKYARELLRGQLLGRVNPVDANRIAEKALRAIEKLESDESHKRRIKDLVFRTIKAEGLDITVTA